VMLTTHPILVPKLELSYNSTHPVGPPGPVTRFPLRLPLHEDKYTFLTISRSVLHRMRDVADKSCRENENTYFVFNIFFFSKIVPFMR
jgi:hypothetical protein